MAERLTDADLDGIARFGVAIEIDQQAMAAELLAYRQKVRALVASEDGDGQASAGPALNGCDCEWCSAYNTLRALVKGE